MRRVGLTGGIGSGKSTIAQILKQMGYPVYIADKQAARLMNEDPCVRKKMICKFGASIYTEKNVLDKQRLASIIFDNKEALVAVNSIVHPRVMEDFRQWCQKQNARLVFFESAILYEAGLEDFFESVVCVSAPPAIRIERVVARDQTSSEQVKERMANQLDDREKCRQSDFVILNDEEHPVIEQVLRMVDQLEVC
ncbi:MAG: dephospho-CoA kinase [Odoribacter sp.]